MERYSESKNGSHDQQIMPEILNNISPNLHDAAASANRQGSRGVCALRALVCKEFLHVSASHKLPEMTLDAILLE